MQQNEDKNRTIEMVTETQKTDKKSQVMITPQEEVTTIKVE
jgi:hypothetical protein